MKKKKYLPLYEALTESRRLQTGGLCWEIRFEIGQKEKELFLMLFGPTGDPEIDSEYCWGGRRNSFTEL